MKPAFRICLLFFVGYFGILYSSLCQVLSEDEKAIQDQAIQHFEKKEYKESLFFINRLLKIYPKDPFFNYYSGVSLTELENDLEVAIYRLKLASLKDVPKNVYFYLGKAFHFSKDFDEAIKYYERFIDFGDRPEVKSLQTERFLEMCRRKTDPNYKRRLQTLKRQESKIKTEEIVKEADEKNQPSAEMKKPVDYNSLLDRALDFQVKADSTRRLADEKRERLDNTSGEEKRSKTKEEILELEKQAFEFQKLADEKYTLVREIEQKRLASQLLTKKKDQSDKEQEGKETTPGSGFVSNEAGMNVMKQIIDDFYLTEDDRSGQARFEREGSSETGEFKYEFTVLKTSPYSASNPIPVNVTLPDRVVYRIQLAVFRNPIPPDYFKGLSPVLAEIIPESGLTRYYAGTFRKFVNAQAALPAVQNLGFQDGFIVAHFMGKKISLNHARNLESADDSFNKDQEIHPDSVKNKSRETGRMTHNLIIKVEVGAYKDQVSEEKMDSFRKMAQDKKVEFYLNKSGFYVYTIGNFLTFDKAEKFKDLLVVNGFRDAAVAAFIGKNKIPVEEAKKLSGM